MSGSPGGERRWYSCSTGMTRGPDGGQKERSRCGQTERCGPSRDGRVAAGGQRWWGWHMTWQADQREGVPIRERWGGELQGGEKDASGARAHFIKAALIPAPTTPAHRGQEVVYTFGKDMTLKAADAIKMAVDEGAACMANRTDHVHPHMGDTWHYAFPGEDGKESTTAGV